MRLSLKSLLPKSLFARALMILVLPMIALQLVVAMVFIQRHVNGATGQMARTVGHEIRLFAAQIEAAPDADAAKALLARYVAQIGYPLAYIPDAEITQTPRPPFWRISERALFDAFAQTLERPFTMRRSPDKRRFGLQVALEKGVLGAAPPRGRLIASNLHLLLVWMAVTALALLLVAAAFLRNQMRPIAQLAEAADAFGRGASAPPFSFRGAAEVRRAAHAFQRMRARIERQIEQRTAMLSGVSHDLRTPLTRMRLALEMEEPGPERDALLSDVAQMQGMIRAYLDFARGEGGEEPQPVKLGEFLAAIAEDARRRGHDLSYAPPEAENVSLEIRPLILRRCLQNLVDNAGEHGAHIWLGAQVEARAVEIWVDDDGPGIALEAREQAFQPFERLQASRDQNRADAPQEASGGVGLGLAIARDAARAHGGELRLLESPQGGLRALLWLPR